MSKEQFELWPFTLNYKLNPSNKFFPPLILTLKMPWMSLGTGFYPKLLYLVKNTRLSVRRVHILLAIYVPEAFLVFNNYK